MIQLNSVSCDLNYGENKCETYYGPGSECAHVYVYGALCMVAMYVSCSDILLVFAGYNGVVTSFSCMFYRHCGSHFFILVFCFYVFIHVWCGFVIS